ncbi:MAG: hypothetical protein ACW99U_05105 [Candidatus Thorarchaeota archaeon]
MFRRNRLTRRMLLLVFILCFLFQSIPVKMSLTVHNAPSHDFYSLEVNGIRSGRSSELIGSRRMLQPIILDTDDVIIEYGESGLLIWYFGSPSSVTYTVYLNGSQLLTGITTDQQIELTLFEPDIGTYNYTLVLSDTGGSSSETTMVYVIDSTLPEIDSPDDIEIVIGDSIPQINWSATDLAPLHWNLFRNNSLIATDVWNETEIVHQPSSLELGVFNFTLQVIDRGGNTASDSVMITVVPDLVIPMISSPDDTVLLESSTDLVITWEVSDDHPRNFRILLDDQEIESGPWNGESIGFNTSALSPGVYNFTLIVWDMFDNFATDSVIVTIEVDYRGLLSLVGIVLGSVVGVTSITHAGFRRRRTRRRLETLESLLTGRRSLTIEEVSQKLGTSFAETSEIIEISDSAIPSADSLEAVNVHMIRERVSAQLKVTGETDLGTVGKEWNLSLQQAASIATSIGIPILGSQSGVYYAVEYLRQTLKQKFLSDGRLDLTIESSERSLTVSQIRPVLADIHDDAFLSTSLVYVPRSPVVETVRETVQKEGYVDLDQVSSQLDIATSDLLGAVEHNLEPSHLLIEGTRLVATVNWIAGLRKQIRESGVINVSGLARDLGISSVALEVLLATYMDGRFDAKRKSFITSVSAAGKEEATVEMPVDVEIMRGGEFVGNRFRYKVKVVNNQDTVITDVTVSLLSYPRDSLRLEGSQTKKFTKIDPRGFRSPAFNFLPTEDCVKGDVVASVSFMDSRNTPHSTATRPLTIRAVCDLLTPESISPEEFHLKLSGFRHGETSLRVEDWSPEEMHSKTLQILESSNFFEVDSKIENLVEHIRSRITGWAKGKYTGKHVGLDITITGSPGTKGATCRITMSGEDEAMIIPALDELASKLSAWLCPMCGGSLSTESVGELKAGRSTPCPYCDVTIDR